MRPRVYWSVSGEAVVLKVSPDRSLIVAEAATLDVWRASGRVPELFEFNDDSGALLMEALRPGTALTSGMKKSRLSEVVGLVRVLHAGADEAVLAGFPPLIERVEFIFEFWGKRLRKPEVAAVIPQGHVLILNLLRFEHELRDSKGLDIPEAGSKGRAISAGEVQMAERLIEAMSGPWDPAKYRDEYREDLENLIEKKIKSGRPRAVSADARAPARKAGGKVVDIMSLLQRSVAQAQKKDDAPRRRKAS